MASAQVDLAAPPPVRVLWLVRCEAEPNLAALVWGQTATEAYRASGFQQHFSDLVIRRVESISRVG